MADKELEILSRLQDTLNLWTAEMSEVRSFISDSTPLTLSEPKSSEPVVGKQIPPIDVADVQPSPFFDEPVVESVDTLNESQHLQAERMLQDSLLDDARKEINHLTETVNNLGEEVRVLRLDVAREEETRLALEQERNDSRNAMEGLVQQLTDSRNELQRTEQIQIDARRETAVLEAELKFAREMLVNTKETVWDMESAHSELALRREEAVQTIGKFRLEYDELNTKKQEQAKLLSDTVQQLTEQESLQEHLQEAEERLDAMVRALKEEQKGRAEQREALEKARYGHLILQGQVEEMTRFQRENKHVMVLDDTSEFAEQDLIALQEELAELRQQFEIRTNLEIALRAEIESLRKVSVEKDFVLNYIQQEIEEKNVTDLKENDLIQEALENTVRWREEVSHQTRESEKLQKLVLTLKDSIAQKELELNELKSSINSISNKVSGKAHDMMVDLKHQELQLEIEELRADNTLSLEVITSLKRELEPWLNRDECRTDVLGNEGTQDEKDSYVEVIKPQPDLLNEDPVTRYTPSVFETVEEVLTINKDALDIPTLPLGTETSSTLEENEVVDHLQINADVQQRVEQFYTRHRGARLIQWGRTLALLNVIALLFWGWAANFNFPQEVSQFTVFHIGFSVSALSVVTGCIMVLLGVKYRL